MNWTTRIKPLILSSHFWWRATSMCLLLSLGLSVKAQDIHYTQFTLQPLQQSPAMTGDFDGNYRFAALYRNQWATVAVPYNTFGVAFDMKAYESKKFTSFLGVGGNAFYDQAGDGRLQSIYAQIPVSYNIYIPVGNKNTMKIGGGLYAGFLHKSLNTSRLQFDNQYAGDVFDPNLPNAENFGDLSFLKPDIGMGYQVAFNINQKASFGVAFGVHHLNKIQESFMDDGVQIALQKRYALPVYMQFELSKKWDLRFDYIFQEQGKFTEHNFGSIASYYLKKDGPAKTAIEFGSYYRYKDALSAIVRYRKNNFLAGLSYDVNLSPLKAATNTYGGLEIGLVYILKNLKEPEIKNKRKCFVF